MKYTPWCTGYYSREFCKKIIEELKASGKYSDVKYGSSVKEGNKRYYRILVMK